MKYPQSIKNSQNQSLLIATVIRNPLQRIITSMTKKDLALPIAVVYTMTTFGSIFGGWLSGNFMKKGWPVYKARMTAMLIFALCVTPVVFAQYLGQFNPWYAILIVGLAASAHQAWSANIFTTASDMFPRKAVASVTGIGGMAG